MASPLSAALCALIGTAFWTVLGFAIARHLLPRPLALGAAPVIGWAIFTAVTLPLLTVIGFSPRALTGLAALCLALAGVSLLRPALWGPIWSPSWSPSPEASDVEPGVKPWWFAAAGLLALVPALALVPKYSGAGVHLAAPIFDHSKIAVIDAMTRQGLPPVNPVFGPAGMAGRVAYYYLWHFSAAELALQLNVSGWEADIALTWFTAFASLCLMMALAVWLSKRAAAAVVVIVLAASASLRQVLSFLAGNYTLEPFLNEPTGFAGWLFQSAWVPQHLMSASCTIAAMLLLGFYARAHEFTHPAHKPAYVVMLALIAAAGFESSAFVGGVTFAIATVAAAPLIFTATDSKRRLVTGLGLAVAALLALCIAAPFIHDQFATVAAREHASPIVVRPFEVLGDMVPSALRRILDLPAYWLILLPLEFPATFIAGVLALVALARSADNGPERTAVRLLGVLAAAGLVVSWFLVSTLGDNNDLALRAILPAAMVLIAAAAAGLFAVRRRSLRTAIAATAFGGLVLSLPDSGAMIASTMRGNPAADAAVFAQTPELWSAVRRYAGVGARVANNPLFLQDLTPWSANISWALLADRSSCFAGRELAIAFASLPPDRREAINRQFIRVFAGQGLPADVGDLATTYGCDVIVVTPQDGAWNNDPFAASADYRLAEARENRWRIYLRVAR
jgi:hypothetical protein